MFRAISDTFWAALRTLGANPLRSALTLLGIVIGIATVVAMASATSGMHDSISKGLNELGAGVFQVQKEPVFGNGRHNADIERRKNLTIAEVLLLQAKCNSCLRVGGEAWEGGQKVSAGEHESRSGVNIVGGTEEFFGNNGYALASGRLFTAAEAMHTGDVVVLGSDIVDVVFPGENPVGKMVRIQNKPFRVIGTIERRGGSMGFSLDNLAAIPISTWFLMYGTKQSINITVQAMDPGQIGRTMDEVTTLLRQERGVAPEKENDFEMFSNSSMQANFDQISGVITMVSIGISAIALLIGGIGVMNIMLVAVTERTSEIGVRRALGARRRRILGQFVTESMMLTFVGGVLGVLLGAFGAYLIRVFADVPASPPVIAVIYSLVVAGGTGLIFGIYPAWRAAQLDPVEAMRQE